MTIYYWTNFSKRKNSTKQPTGTGTSKTVTLKEGTSIERPTFVFSSNDFTINYIQAFGHYYFVDDIKSVRNDLIEVSCSMDVLATFKSDIGSYTAFIERSATHYDTKLPDPYVIIKNSEQTVGAWQPAGSHNYPLFSSMGFYVISVLNNLGSGAGFTTYYTIEASELMQLAQYVNTDWGGAIGPGGTLVDAFNNIVSWLQATFLHTADSIIDCIYLPISQSQLIGGSLSSETVKIGIDVVSGVTGKRFTAPVIVTDNFEVSIPASYSDFRRGAPYTIGKLYLPGYGMIDINPLDFSNNIIYVRFDVDISTGDVSAFLTNNSNTFISVVTYNIGISCPVGKVGNDVGGTIGGILSTAGSMIAARTTGGVTDRLDAVSSAINTLSTAVHPTASVHGSKGGRSMYEYGEYPYCSIVYKDTTSPSSLTATQGRVYMASAQISTCSGYVKCSNASVEIAGMESEKEAVNNFLNSGFYYE